MHIFRGFDHSNVAPLCALTIGNFDGVHRGHQAMLALLCSEAAHRGLPACVLTFEPHPRDYFASRTKQPAPTRIASLRDKVGELERCGIDQVVVLRFDQHLAALTPQQFITQVLQQGLGVRYVLVGDDFRFGARRAGDYTLLDAIGEQQGFDVARMNSYEVHGARVSSSAVRAALMRGDMTTTAALLGRPYSISGHVLHGQKLGRELGFRTLNVRLHHKHMAAQGIFAVRVQGLVGDEWHQGVASLGKRPTVDSSGHIWLETHVLVWPQALGPEGGYGRLIRVELIHKIRDEACYDSLVVLQQAIADDVSSARAFFSSQNLMA